MLKYLRDKTENATSIDELQQAVVELIELLIAKAEDED